MRMRQTFILYPWQIHLPLIIAFPHIFDPPLVGHIAHRTADLGSSVPCSQLMGAHFFHPHPSPPHSPALLPLLYHDASSQLACRIRSGCWITGWWPIKPLPPPSGILPPKQYISRALHIPFDIDHSGLPSLLLAPHLTPEHVQESEWLLDQGLVADQNSATKAIGYRQSLEFLQSHRRAGTTPDAKGLVSCCIPQTLAEAW